MNLRPHHLLCIQKYTGHGYDEKFTEHMNNTVATLKSENVNITLQEGCDDLCVACPNRVTDKCNTYEKVRKLDEDVLRICELDYNATDRWENFANLAKEKILLTDEFKKICGTCQWYELCENTPI